MHAAPPAITGGGAAFYKRGLRKGPVPSGYFSARAETDLALATCHAVCKLAAGCCGKGAPIFKSALPAASQEAEGQTPLQGASTGVAQSRTAGVCLLLSASAAAHEGGNRLSARWKKAIPAQTVYRKKPPSENGRFWTITASKILTGQRQRGFAKQNTRL